MGWETTHTRWNSWGAERVVNTHVSVRACAHIYIYNFISTDLGNYNQMIINGFLGFLISELDMIMWVVGTMF